MLEAVGQKLETTTSWPGPAIKDLGSGKRGLKRGLKGRHRSVILFEDETIITETPPLMAAWTDRGEPAVIPITGNRSKRILFGTISLNGGMILHDADQWTQEEFQTHLHMIRAHWRGWNPVLFVDRGSPHTSEDSEFLAKDLGIELRLLPVACPKLNPVDHLWRHVKGDVLANFADQPLDTRIEYVYHYLQDIGPLGWSRKAGLLSEKFWLKEYVFIQ